MARVLLKILQGRYNSSVIGVPLTSLPNSFYQRDQSGESALYPEAEREGGSGGALALAVSDRVFMLENAIYSVISPEGCAGILWKDKAKAKEAAEVLKLTASDILEQGVIDGLIELGHLGRLTVTPSEM